MLPYLVIGILLLGVLALIAIVLVLATWRPQLPEVEEVGVEDYPASALERQKNLAAKMEEAGFEFAGMQVERRGAKYEVWQALFRTANGAVWGVVEAARNETPRIVFHTFFSNGRTVTTADGEFADYNVTEDWRLTEQKWGNLREQAAHHQRRALGAGAKPLALMAAEAFREKYAETARQEYAHLESIGFLTEVPGEKGVFRVSACKAPGIALRMLLHSSRYQWSEQGRRRDEAYQAQLQAEKEERRKYDKVAEYRYIEYYKRDRKRGTAFSLLGWTLRGAVLFLSIVALLLIAVAGGKIEPATAGVILGVLLVHELGHALAMRAFGYRDFSVFFLPLVGLLAGNRKVRVPAWQEFVALVMGPLPGMIAGWGLVAASYFVPEMPEIWKQAGFWAALINNINFLAVLPYDGGRIVNLLVFERVPALRVLYLVFSGLAVVAVVIVSVFAVGGWAFAVLWPFLIIGVSAFLAIPDNWRLARMAPWAKRNLSPGDDETEALVKAFLIVEQTGSVRGLEKRGWTEFVDCVLKQGCSRKLGFLGTAAALLFTMMCLYTPLWMFFGVAIGESAKLRAEHRQLAQRIDELADGVSWAGAVVTEKTRADLEMLRDNYQESLELLYNDVMMVDAGDFDYDARGIFDPSEAVEKVKNLRWDEVSTWIGEKDTAARQQTARVLVEALIGNAADQAKAGNMSGAMIGLSKACWAISTCEPKTSLAAWIDWLYLEHALLEELEELVAQRGIPAQYSSWFASTLRTRPRFEGEKLALLLLFDLQGDLRSFVPPARDSGEESVELGEVLAELGYPLRSTEADRDIRRERGESEGMRGPGDLMELVRIVQGLPTREEYEAGLVLAEEWSRAREFDLAALDRVADGEQRALWKARLDRIQRLVHFRLLTVAALETELSSRAAASGELVPVRPVPPVQITLVAAPDQRYAVSSHAPDGTRQLFRLSPQFAVYRRAN